MIDQNIKSSILKIPRNLKRLFVVIIDVSLCVLAVWIAYYLRIGEFLSLLGRYNEHFPLPACIVGVLTSIPIFYIFNFYNIIFRYTSSQSIINIGKAVTVYAFFYIIIFTLVIVEGVPRTIGIIQPIIFFLLISFSRFFAVYFLGEIYAKEFNLLKKKQALIYGAGDTGHYLSRALFKNSRINVVGFIDNNISLHGNRINNLNIYSPKELDKLVKKNNVTEIIFALGQKNTHLFKKVIKEFQGKKLNFRTLPTYEDLVQDEINLGNVRDLSINDILGRKTVTPDPILMQRDITNKVVLVSGAGGSIGSELCKQICYQKPKTLILVDHSEFAIYNITEQLRRYNNSNDTKLIPILCSVTDKNSIGKLLKKFKPETVFHTAAYKHVHLVEQNKIQGLNNNIFGTLTLSQAAINAGVRKFVLISSDKAVRPSNIMGASKRISEMVIQALSTNQKKTIFSIVRFGNVLESSGSVVPLFRSQIKSGGPLTVTHKDITRYFMTIEEAAQLVIQAGAITEETPKNRETAPIYILEMGEPFKIFSLAKLMIELSGLSVYNGNKKTGDIKIKIIGLRPGEKIHEELLIGNVSANTSHPKIKYANEFSVKWPEMKNTLLDLKSLISMNKEKDIVKLVFKLSSQENSI